MILDWIQNQFSSNPFFNGAIGGSIAYSILNYGKSLLSRILNPLKNLTKRNIVVSSIEDKQIFNHLNKYFFDKINNPQSISFKKMNSRFGKISVRPCPGSDVNYSNVLGYGTHYYWYNFYTIVYVSIEAEKEVGQEKSEIMTISICGLFANRTRSKIANMFIQEHKEIAARPIVHKMSGGFPEFKGHIKQRPISYIFIEESIKNIIFEKINYIENNKKIFENLNINQTFGIILYGKPGTGKSSLVKALAHELNRNLYYVSFASDITDQIDGCANIMPNSILVIEDMDSYPVFRNRSEKAENSEDAQSKKELASILKMLDGDDIPDGTIIIATTNDIDSIDDAIKRAGRFDLKIEIGPANREIAEEMVNHINPSKKYILDQIEYPISQAELQSLILR